MNRMYEQQRLIRVIHRLHRENAQLRFALSNRHAHEYRPGCPNLQLKVFTATRDLITANPRQRIHLNQVAQLFPDHCPETIKRRVQELAQDGLLTRTGYGFYTLPNIQEQEATP